MQGVNGYWHVCYKRGYLILHALKHFLDIFLGKTPQKYLCLIEIGLCTRFGLIKMNVNADILKLSNIQDLSDPTV